MFARFKAVLLASFVAILLAVPAVAQEEVRVPLDWEPDPNHPSEAVVKYHCGHPKIVYLLGGKAIRQRAAYPK